MPNQIGANDHVLIQGRISYGMSGTAAVASQVDASGGQVLAAGTAAAGTVAVSNIETIQTALFAPASVAASSVVLSSTLSVVGIKRASVLISHSRANTSAFGVNGTEYRVEVSAQSSGNDTWLPIASVLASSAVAASAAASSDCAAGTTLVTITSATAMPANSIICFTSGTIEWVYSTIATGTASFNIIDGTTYGHASATGLFAGAEHFPLMNLNVEAATRLRCVINNQASGTTQAIFSRIACITEK